MATIAAAQNYSRLTCPCGTTMNATSSGPDGSAEIAADLEQRLGEPVAATGRYACHARGLLTEDRVVHADQSGENRMTG